MYRTDTSETDSDRPSATLELLTLLAAGAPVPDRSDPSAPTASAASDRSSPSAALRPRRSDLRERLTDGVVELRKRGRISTRRAGPPGPPGAPAAEHYLEAMALRAAERASRPRG
ncbi:hypothetical protein SAVIM338S_06146 [Streptomyces avidinii]